MAVHRAPAGPGLVHQEDAQHLLEHDQSDVQDRQHRQRDRCQHRKSAVGVRSGKM